MKESYLEDAQKEVFAEAKNPTYFAPSEGFLKGLKKDIVGLYDLFAKGIAEDLKVINATKISKLAEQKVSKLIRDSIDGMHDSDNFYNEYEAFKSECVSKGYAKD